MPIIVGGLLGLLALPKPPGIDSEAAKVLYYAGAGMASVALFSLIKQFNQYNAQRKRMDLQIEFPGDSFFPRVYKPSDMPFPPPVPKIAPSSKPPASNAKNPPTS